MNEQRIAEGIEMRRRLAPAGLCRWLAVLVAAGCLLLVFAAAAPAAIPAAAWSVHSFALPSSFSAGDDAQCLSTLNNSLLCDAYEVTARDAGSVAMDGSTIA